MDNIQFQSSKRDESSYVGVSLGLKEEVARDVSLESREWDERTEVAHTTRVQTIFRIRLVLE